ncbi:MAG: inorganic phosphate transporter [bacterium]
MTLVLIVIVVALAFEYINGFHDTANAIATVVATKVLTPRQAVLLAATANLLGAMWGTAVAKTIATGLIDVHLVAITSEVLICALLGAIVWNLLTWWFGLPSSSSHALIGGLCGAALAASHNNWMVIVWSLPSKLHWYLGKGMLWKVIVPMITSPLLGFFLAFCLMALLFVLLRNARPARVSRFFRHAQIASASAMGLMHGTNDAQKTMGIVALALLGATQAGQFETLPDCLSFLRATIPLPGQNVEIPLWIKVICALTMAAGTAVGGWRVIKTLGHKMVKLQPINGFAAETSSALVIFTATHLGIPVSTTHNISAAIMGVGSAKRLSAIRWSVVEQILWAWLLTIPVTAGTAYLLVRLLQALGWMTGS